MGVDGEMMMEIRHTFKRGPYTLWADRAPVMHGEANLFSLYRDRAPGLGSERVCGAVSMRDLRLAIACCVRGGAK